MLNKDRFRGFSNETILLQILDAKRNNFCDEYIIQIMYWVFSDIILKTDNVVIEMIVSNNNETSNLRIQLMFSYWLSWYNDMFDNSSWKITMSNIIKFIAEGMLEDGRDFYERLRF